MEANTNSVIEHKLIVLNSKDGDKLNGEYLSHVRFNFRDILKGRRYILCGYSISRNTVFFYNINVNNSTLNYSVNSTDYSLTLTEGNYNATTFISEFVSQFNSGDTVILFLCLSIITGKLTTTKTSGLYDIVYSSGSIYEVLGLLEDEYTIATSLIHPYMLNLLGVKKLKIFSPSFSSLENFDSTGHTSGALVHTISVNMPCLILY
jgi:hypothetical protein